MADTYQTNPKAPGASVLLTIDATSQLPEGVTLAAIAGVVVTAAQGYVENPPALTYSGAIINPATVTDNGITIAPLRAVQMTIAGGTSPLWYQVAATCTTSDPSLTLVLYALVPVESKISPNGLPVPPSPPAYSGTVGETVVTVQALIDEGARRSGKLASELSAEQIISAKQSLFMVLSNLINLGIQYFALEKQVIGLLANQQQYTLPVGANDVLNALYRYMQRPTGIYTSSDGQNPANAFDQNTSTWFQQNTPNGNILVDYGLNNPQYIGSIGFMPYIAGGGSGSWSFAYQASPDGVNWQTIGTYTNQTVVDGEWLWLDIDPGANTEFYRVQAFNGTTLGVREFFLGTFSTEITMSRLNRDDYTNLPNKNFTANDPYQYWFDRTIPVPTLYMWPVPSTSFTQATVWYSRQIQDVGQLSGKLAVPDRWLLAIQTMLAHQMAQSIPGVDLQRILYLEKQAEKYFGQAELEERDRSPIYFAPNIAPYSR